MRDRPWSARRTRGSARLGHARRTPSASRAYAAGASNASTGPHLARAFAARPSARSPTRRRGSTRTCTRGSIDDGARPARFCEHLSRSPPQRAAAAGYPAFARTATATSGAVVAHQRPRRPSDPRVRGADAAAVDRRYLALAPRRHGRAAAQRAPATAAGRGARSRTSAVTSTLQTVTVADVAQRWRDARRGTRGRARAADRRRRGCADPGSVRRRQHKPSSFSPGVARSAARTRPARLQPWDPEFSAGSSFAG